MKYCFLDTKQQVKVSKICLGTMTWGYQNTEQDAHEQLDYALSQGINFIDTAEIYAVPPSADTYGKTETYIGTWLAQRPSVRQNVVIATKIAGPGPAYIRQGEGFTPQGIVKAIEASLKRLQTDYIDLYQLHWPHRKVNYFGTYNYDPAHYSEATTHEEQDHIRLILETLDTQIKLGKIRFIGVSNETSWGVMTFQNIARTFNLPLLTSIQNVYNLVTRSFDLNLSEVCLKEKVGLLAYSPLAGGLLSGKYRNGAQPKGARFSTWGFSRMDRYETNRTLEAIEVYSALAEKHHLSPTQLALAFVNQRPFVTSNIIGATSLAQLKENIDSIDITLSNEIIKDIERIFNDYKNPAA